MGREHDGGCAHSVLLGRYRGHRHRRDVGVNFHQISLPTARRLSPVEAAANFIPQTVAALLATFAAGYLADRVRGQYLVALCMISLFAALILGTVARPGLLAVVFGLLIGSAGGGIRALEAATIARYFGTRHLGAIRGVVTAVGVGASAFGPLLLAGLHQGTGSYPPALLTVAVLPVAVAISTLIVSPPTAATTLTSTGRELES